MKNPQLSLLGGGYNINPIKPLNTVITPNFRTTDNNDGTYIATSTISTGNVLEKTEYKVTLFYRGKVFEKIGFVYIYGNFDPILCFSHLTH